MSENIFLKNDPKIEFQFLENGFELIDRQTNRNSGFYSYDDLLSIDLDNAWFPRLAKWLRAITWIINGVPFFPDSDSYKKAKLTIHSEKSNLSIWLTDTFMAEKAKNIKEILDTKSKQSPNNHK
ncbi:MAG TPA: hypothetical protein DGP89_09550 [Saprospirales bacterium]|jgi:hypothetical protein|nr:hypothetical protein [Saprospirales bacterium]